MTASTNQRQAEQILRAMSLCKERLGVKCALGVSNISFGLPARPLLGSVFLAAAFWAGFFSSSGGVPSAGLSAEAAFFL